MIHITPPPLDKRGWRGRDIHKLSTDTFTNPLRTVTEKSQEFLIQIFCSMSDAYDRMAHGIFIVYVILPIVARIIHSTAPRLAAAVCHRSLIIPYITINTFDIKTISFSGISERIQNFQIKNITIRLKKITGIWGITIHLKKITGIFGASTGYPQASVGIPVYSAYRNSYPQVLRSLVDKSQLLNKINIRLTSMYIHI